MRVIPQGGAPKRGKPEASASLASPLTHHCLYSLVALAMTDHRLAR